MSSNKKSHSVKNDFKLFEYSKITTRVIFAICPSPDLRCGTSCVNVSPDKNRDAAFCRIELMQYKCVSTPIFIGAGATTADSSNAAGIKN